MTYPLLTDQPGLVIRKWGVFDADQEIALPATFFVTRGGSIVYKYVGTSQRDRPDPLDLVALADKHKLPMP